MHAQELEEGRRTQRLKCRDDNKEEVNRQSQTTDKFRQMFLTSYNSEK